MRIVADENIPLLNEFFSDLGELTALPGRLMTAEQLQNADVLLVRSVTQVNRALLENSSVRFVGTCTIGTDHVDTEWLSTHNIAFANAPGCNAQAVADYVLSSLCTYAEQRSVSIMDLCVAIVGVGNVGQRVRALLERLGVRTLGVDPFKTEADVGKLLPLHDALVQADVLCLHTPLTTTGTHPTHHLIGTQELALMNTEACLLNAGRGPVVDNAALFEHLQTHQNFEAILDVWEHEPIPNAPLLQRCLLATPHIAGYSLDGKMRGTAMIYSALCDFLNRPATHSLESFLPEPAVLALTLSSAVPNAQRLSTQVRAIYDVRNDDGRMRYAMRNATDVAHAFDHLRKHYPLRRELDHASLAKDQ